MCFARPCDIECKCETSVVQPLENKVFSFILGNCFLLGARAVMMVSQVVVVRLLITLLGVDQYSAVAVLTSLAGWFLLADLGLSSSVQNFAAERVGTPLSQYEFAQIASMVVSIFVILAGVAWWFLSRFIADSLFHEPKIYGLESGELRAGMFWAGLLFLSQACAWVVWRFWYGEHRGWLANVFMATGTLVGLFGVGIVGSKSFLINILLLWGPSALLAVISFTMVQISAWKAGARFSWPILPQLWNRSWRFWLLNFAAALVLRSDYIVLAYCVSDPMAIAVYSLVMRIMNAGFTIFSSVLTGVAPVMTTAFSSGDAAHLKSLLKMCIAGGIGYSVILGIGVVLAREWIVELLAPDQGVVIPVALCAFSGLYFLVRSWVDPCAILINSLSALKYYSYIVPLHALAVVSAMLLLAPQFGTYGVVIGMTVGYLLTLAWALPLRARSLLEGNLC